MAQSSFDTFIGQARSGSGYRIVPVFKEYLADTITPVSAFMSLVGYQDEGFLLESVEKGERWSRFSFVGRHTLAEVSVTNGQVKITSEVSLPDTAVDTSSFLSTLEFFLENISAEELTELTPLNCGFVGYIGYDIIREIEDLPDPPMDDYGFPDAIMRLIGEIAVFDHWRQKVILISNVLVEPTSDDEDLKQKYQSALVQVENMASQLGTSAPNPMNVSIDSAEEPVSATSSLSTEQYARAVLAAQEYIRAGDIFQVVLSKRFSFQLGAHPVDFYRVLRQLNPSPYMYLLRFGSITVAGSSPEPVVKVMGNRVISRPIAGTRPRGSNDLEDQALGAELLEHPKEIAEHLMLVDLARNDIGRVAEFKTEAMDELMVLERYSHVMHMTSQVSAVKRAGSTSIDVLKATLPAGTVSGAPKIRAMEIINELEPVKRGPYAGLVGYIDFSGNLDAAIAIRTLFSDSGGRSFVQAGAGIVADSEPLAEDMECTNKAKALLIAVGAARKLAISDRDQI
ncbi:MAG: chorismate-binding protein [Actinobacteria bacterium]|jgi:anthranilate synthase component 1|nr:chorismate-binding protein [Actinomycetota bacterium]